MGKKKINCENRLLSRTRADNNSYKLFRFDFSGYFSAIERPARLLCTRVIVYAPTCLPFAEHSVAGYGQLFFFFIFFSPFFLYYVFFPPYSLCSFFARARPPSYPEQVYTRRRCEYKGSAAEDLFAVRIRTSRVMA